MTMVDAATRGEIEEMMARYCHFMDDGDTDAWVGLFTPNGVFEIEGLNRLEGSAQLAEMPAMFFQSSGGNWRHQVTNIIADEDAATGNIKVKAYGLVTDWSAGGRLVTFGRYTIEFRRGSGGLRLASVLAKVTAAN